MKRRVATCAVLLGTLAGCADGSRRLAVPSARTTGPWAAHELMKQRPAAPPVPEQPTRWMDFTSRSLRIAPASARRLTGAMPALSIGVGRDARGDFLSVWHVDENQLVRRPRDGATSSPGDLRVGDTTLHSAVVSLRGETGLRIVGELWTDELIAQLAGAPSARAIVARSLGYAPDTLPERLAVRIDGEARW